MPRRPPPGKWSPEKALPPLQDQLRRLNEFKGKTSPQGEHDEEDDELPRFEEEEEEGEQPLGGVVEVEEITIEEEQDEDNSRPLILISHSSKDEELALALIELLRAGLGLLPGHIRCSSVDGYRLPAGVTTDTQLRFEVNEAKVLIGLITPNSLASPYVLFELGARWGAGSALLPLLAGVSAGELRGPLSGINSLSCSSEAQLHQFLGDVGSKVQLTVQSPASLLRYVSGLKAKADALQVALSSVEQEKKGKVHFVPDAHSHGWAENDSRMDLRVSGTLIYDGVGTLIVANAFFKGTQPKSNMMAQVLTADGLGPSVRVNSLELHAHVPLRVLLNLWLTPVKAERGKPLRGQLVLRDIYNQDHDIDPIDWPWIGGQIPKSAGT